MIRYELNCDRGHVFEGWFQNSAAFDRQSAGGHVSCPECGGTGVSKAIMAPSLATRGDREPAHPRSGMREKLREFRAEVEANAEYVGPRFAEEARRIHFEETVSRGVYGEATPVEVCELIDDGVPVLPLPSLKKEN